MQILVNKRNEIISYAVIGGFEEGIDIESLPENFSQVFRPKVFKYSDGKIIFNEDYTEEKDDSHQQIDNEENSTGASDDILRKMVASMQKQVVQSTKLLMQVNKQNALMAKQIVAFNKKLEEIKGETENA
ncbi:DUF2977 domain-containing protein [Staphylococcus aureus]|uniref:DUF2977 domain-containing protein n=2 Tax=Staphylococcus aureus TaxID=1280 RepID=UPI0001C11EC7|nr:DUF2977 domain-containing protein [Staphylococcus aureus]UWJ04716.1 hypothetical protein [Staphylococcus phage PHB38a]HDH6421190.1 DUF2977 domain-containing protein [Staphylococcus aureus MRSA-Lux-33]HDH6423784.1 DUF2977 domain-containing protein [Staphylococcus aureus MRSA-Lux-34]HDH6426295.1 DUF2977 domain-containing protein [Staphylococcus aureus MRSA-Lux-32]HDH6428830.1 DUF2977 domain-containing protein [Staphylococcus aureus MRSA-Lux-31]